MNKIITRTLQGIVAAAIISGTYFGRGKDSILPLYSHKTKDSYGINLALYTEIDSGINLYGANISFLTQNSGRINGLNYNVFINNHKDEYSAKNSTTNGLELSLLCNASESNINGVQASLIANGASKLNGIQIGLLNIADKLIGVQIGIYNEADGSKSVLLNVDYQKRINN
jgi:hypothetical protein